MKRRQFLKAAALPLLTATQASAQASAHVIVVGGGFAGLACAKYLRLYSPKLRITLIDPSAAFYSAPFSNRVLLGVMANSELTKGYDAYASTHGTTFVQESVTGIQASRRELTLSSGKRLNYDRLIIAPGVHLDFSGLNGLSATDGESRMPHAWRGGAAMQLLQRRIADLRDGNVVGIHVPKAPFRGQASPYERACMIAARIQERRVSCKVLLFDANSDIVEGRALFANAFKTLYSGIIEYTPNAQIKSVAANENTVEFEKQGKVPATLWNVIPPQRAGLVAASAGLVNAVGGWCDVDYSSYESSVAPYVHVIGDSTANIGGMSRLASVASQQGKICAAYLARSLAGAAALPVAPIIAAEYSYVSRRNGAHRLRVYRYDPTRKHMVADAKAGGQPMDSRMEGIYGAGWLSNLLSDTLD